MTVTRPWVLRIWSSKNCDSPLPGQPTLIGQQSASQPARWRTTCYIFVRFWSTFIIYGKVLHSLQDDAQRAKFGPQILMWGQICLLLMHLAFIPCMGSCIVSFEQRITPPWFGYLALHSVLYVPTPALRYSSNQSYQTVPNIPSLQGVELTYDFCTTTSRKW